MKIELNIGRDSNGNLGAFLYVDGRSFPGAIYASTLEGLLRDASIRPELIGVDAVLDSIELPTNIGL